jgi:phosphoribosylamine--glycine ligase
MEKIMCCCPKQKIIKEQEEEDSGPNTGGMGAVSPVPFADEDFLKNVEEKVIKPTIEGLKADWTRVSWLYFLWIN